MTTYAEGTYKVGPDSLIRISGTEHDLTTGYWVAETDYPAPANDNVLHKFAEELVISYGVDYVGIYINSKNETKIDASHHVEDLLQAVAIGRYWGQESIWDIKHSQLIYI